jgi:acetylornithine/succinyldiaminopimelate/putrescine aminotransferase
MMLAIELAPNIPAFAGEGKTAAVRFTNLLHAAGLLAIPTATQIVRFLPALNLHRGEVEEGLKIIESVTASLAG